MDQPNRVVTALREGRKAYGFQLTFPAPQIIEIMAPLNFDYVCWTASTALFRCRTLRPHAGPQSP
jgi:2-keto-3-deoxy-L-rhamnonate aldolase RhmA